MGQPDKSQLNIRSRFAKERAAGIARQTGMTVTQVVEEALRSYHPLSADPPAGLVSRGRLLVHPGGGRKVSTEEVEKALEALRTGRA